jgi:hypothetical protein
MFGTAELWRTAPPAIALQSLSQTLRLEQPFIHTMQAHFLRA